MNRYCNVMYGWCSINSMAKCERDDYVTSKLKLHGDALVLQAVYDLTAVSPRVVAQQRVDDQRRVTWGAPAQTHATPEVAVTPMAGAKSHHDVSLFGVTCARLPEPFHPRPARRTDLRLVPVFTRKSHVASLYSRHQSLWRFHVKTHTFEVDCGKYGKVNISKQEQGLL